MYLVAQNETNPGEVLSALLSITNEHTTALRIAVAYTTMGGCDLLISQLALRIGRIRWERLQKTFVTALDFGITEPDALAYLLTIPGTTVRVAGADLLQGRSLQPSRAYHPKFYAFDRSTGVGLVVGSANLTVRGLTVNTEAAMVHENLSSTEVDQAWSVLITPTAILDSTLLEQYRSARRAVPMLPPPELPVLPRPAALPGLLTFNDAIIAGQLVPEQFNQFWLEAGSMSSGGSHTQLELPRGAHRFFGFRFTAYDGTHRTLGHPALAIGSRHWMDRPLTWHGDNAMERLNLPSVAQGGYEQYAGTAILFRRVGAMFELEVVDWASALAASWRNASAERGVLYKLGQNSPRICGVL